VWRPLALLAFGLSGFTTALRPVYTAARALMSADRNRRSAWYLVRANRVLCVIIAFAWE
jgi:hypothetical protein